MHNDGILDDDLTKALARLAASFEGLAATQEKLGDTLVNSMGELTRQITAIDVELSRDRRYR
ncbi:MAG: hypothetical protein KDJ45_06365 [Hyphomicrobiaceae bacterium]|nr:hypothetical protein [Hyphomicrobiaceae bacterium]MCC0009275.1 hypothetical protein [Hyphomicrobiaceae bacterium]